MARQPVAIVTAAGQGIGEAIARELAARGYALALMSPSGASTRLARELGGIGLDGSIGETADLERLVRMTLDEHGRIDAVVNNTGRDPWSQHVSGPGYDADLPATLFDIPDSAWHDSVDMSVLNVVRMGRLVTPAMIERGGGAIVNISTFAALEPRLIFPVSSALRLALAGITKLYADQYGKHGIRMNNVLPGFMDNWPVDEAVRRTIPLARPGEMAEVAKTVAFLLSSDAGYITGQNILVDGGVNRGF